MAEQGKDWSNVRRQGKQEYLPDEEFIALKRQVRRAWLALGMLHLRMENDVNLGLKKKLPKSEISQKLAQAKELILQIEAELHKGGGE